MPDEAIDEDLAELDFAEVSDGSSEELDFTASDSSSDCAFFLRIRSLEKL